MTGRAARDRTLATLVGVSTTTPAILRLGNRFATELAELALPWQGEEAPDPRLLVLNGPLAAELGVEPDGLRGPDGLRLLTGTLVPPGATPVAPGLRRPPVRRLRRRGSVTVGRSSSAS